MKHISKHLYFILFIAGVSISAGSIYPQQRYDYIEAMKIDELFKAVRNQFLTEDRTT